MRSIYADWEGGDFTATVWAHPEIEFVIARGPAPGSWVGLTAMAEVWSEVLDAWDDYRTESTTTARPVAPCAIARAGARPVSWQVQLPSDSLPFTVSAMYSPRVTLPLLSVKRCR